MLGADRQIKYDRNQQEMAMVGNKCRVVDLILRLITDVVQCVRQMIFLQTCCLKSFSKVTLPAVHKHPKPVAFRYSNVELKATICKTKLDI